MSFLRTFARGAMNVPNLWAATPQKYPHLMNYTTVAMGIVFITVAGKGAEKFTVNSYVNSSNLRNYFEI